MYKSLIAFLILVLAVATGYFYFTKPQPLAPKEMIESGVKQVKDKAEITPEQEVS